MINDQPSIVCAKYNNVKKKKHFHNIETTVKICLMTYSAFSTL